MSSRPRKTAAAAAASPTPSASPPRGPFVLPKDRPPRRAPGDANAADADGQNTAWCNWMCRLCTYKEAPEWSVHNNYIHTGYRDTSTFRGAIRSVRTHTDTKARERGNDARARRPSPVNPTSQKSSHVLRGGPSTTRRKEYFCFLCHECVSLGCPTPAPAPTTTPAPLRCPPLTRDTSPTNFSPTSVHLYRHFRRCSWFTTRRRTYGPTLWGWQSSSSSPPPWCLDGAPRPCPRCRWGSQRDLDPF